MESEHRDRVGFDLPTCRWINSALLSELLTDTTTVVVAQFLPNAGKCGVGIAVAATIRHGRDNRQYRTTVAKEKKVATSARKKKQRHNNHVDPFLHGKGVPFRFFHCWVYR